MMIVKFRVGMAALLVLGIAALFFVVNAFAQAASETLNCPSGQLGIYDVQEGVNVECVNAPFATLTPVVGPTDTPIPPTDIPPTDVPPSGHNSEEYHALWNGPDAPFVGAPACQSMSESNCHWDHSHSFDPSRLDSVFGPVGSLYGGQEISYPWQTFRPPGGSGNMENEIKHTGYRWEVHEISDFGTDCITTGFRGSDNCIVAWRVSIHSVGGMRSAVTRLHSFWAELLVCEKDNLSNCGTVKTGGWNDFGILVIPYQETHIPLPRDPDPITQSVAVDPYRGHNDISFCPHYAIIDGEKTPSNLCSYIWTTSNRYGFNRIFNMVLRVKDDWQGIDSDDPFREEPNCPDGSCGLNHSNMIVDRIWLNLPATDFSGFTNRQGQIDESCSAPGLNCIPLEISGVPGRTASMEVSSLFSHSLAFDYEHDLSPEGESWMVYPFSLP